MRSSAQNPRSSRSVVSAAVAESLHEPTAIVNASEKAQRVLEEADRRGVRVLSIFDADYPAALRSLSDRPPILFVKGKLPVRRSVACIGTRSPPSSAKSSATGSWRRWSAPTGRS